MSRMPTRKKRGVQSVAIPPVWKVFSVLQKCSNVKLVTSLGTLPAFVVRKRSSIQVQEPRGMSITSRGSMCKKVPYAVNLKITDQVRIPFACRSKCSGH